MTGQSRLPHQLTFAGSLTCSPVSKLCPHTALLRMGREKAHLVKPLQQRHDPPLNLLLLKRAAGRVIPDAHDDAGRRDARDGGPHRGRAGESPRGEGDGAGRGAGGSEEGGAKHSGGVRWSARCDRN